MMTLTIIFTCAATCLVLICIAPSSCWAAVAQTAQAQATVEAGAGGLETRYCEFYNETACSKNANNCYSHEECEPLDSEKRNHCFVLWHTDNATGASTIKLKGCFMDSKECYDREACIEESHRPKKDLMFCCCEGNMCNQNFTWIPSPTEAPAVIVGTQPETEVAFYKILLYAGLAVTVLAAGALSLCFMYRRNKMNLFNELPTAEPSCPPSPEGLEEGGNLPIILREVRARGRFGAVWRAHLNQQEVAVKIFPVQDKQSWVSEQEIFKLPRMNHADILQYIGVEKRGDNLQAEYWLITAYHEKGSLCDYLKANTLTWAEAWRVAHTMSRGLTHLHDEVAASRAGARKPALAHRDFKSKNVLLKTDMSVCIADFGLALVFQPGKPCGDTHGQVGTRRYMAPEVLEGAINFTRDAFLRIDMYACGLVLWEIASRSQAWGTPGSTCYLSKKKWELIHHLKRCRRQSYTIKLDPKIPELWRKHSGLAVMCDTMEECWDHDAEARLSASCVMERIGALTRLRRRSLPQHLPLLIENALPLTPTSASSILSNSNLNSNRDE